MTFKFIFPGIKKLKNVKSSNIYSIWRCWNLYFWNQYKHDSSDFNKDKNIPFIKLLNDIVGAGAVYYRNQTRMGRYENYPLLAKNITKKAGQLKRSYNKIKNLSDDLLCTVDIQTIDYCLEVYRQYVNNEKFDPFLYNEWEIKQTLSALQLELIKFKKHNIVFIKEIKKLLPINNKLTPLKLQEMFMEDLQKQF